MKPLNTTQYRLVGSDISLQRLLNYLSKEYFFCTVTYENEILLINGREVNDYRITIKRNRFRFERKVI